LDAPKLTNSEWEVAREAPPTNSLEVVDSTAHAREKPRHAKHEAGLIIVPMCAQSSRAGVRGSASFCIFEFLVRAVWSDQ
jgi:hypothetical protein